jgi:hypothetical protein
MVASYDFSGAFNITGVNRYVPFVSFDPSADGIPYASVLHYTDAISIIPSSSSDVTERHSLHSNVCISGKPPSLVTIRANRMGFLSGHVIS